MKVIIGTVLIFSIWVIFISSKQIERNYRIEREVEKLQSEADKIRHENETLSEKIAYFSSDDFREQEAKKKLGLKKAEENVVVIVPRPESLIHDEISTEKSSYQGMVGDPLPNYKKWWRLFFYSDNQ